MTDKVQPSPSQTLRSFTNSGIHRYATLHPGWVVPSTETKFASYMGLTGTPLGAFNATTSASSLDVTIAGGEAFVEGKWLGRDTDTTVTLSASTSGQEIYVGWPADTGNSVIIGPASSFPANHGKIKIWTFTTDGSGVTSSTDERIQNPGGVVEPVEHIPTVALDDGDTAEVRAPVSTNRRLVVTGWGSIDTSNNNPAGLTVELLNASGTLIQSANTRWSTDPDGIATFDNTGATTQWAILRVNNSTGTSYLDPDGVSAAFAYELEAI